ncbi:MAG: PorT family protein [Muribaculaceae bacterium]|nr:PorT family protein [Muribaculaceae bacterium]
MKDKWLEELREGMSGFEMDAPEGLWESLGVEKPAPKVSWRKRWIAAAAVIAILVIGSGAIMWLSKNESLKTNDIRYAKTNADRHPGQSVSHPAVTEKTTPTPNESLCPTGSQNSGNLHHQYEGITETIASYVSTEEPVPVDTVRPEEDVRPDWQDTHPDNATGSERQYIKRRNDDRFAIKMSASGMGNATEGMLYRMPGMNGNDFFLSGSDAEPWFGASSLETIKVRHHQPVRFGLTLQYNVSERIGIETGLVYSRIGSDISVSRDNKTSIGIRRLQYVGIPLNVKFSAWSWKFIGLYLSAGATGEKCVSNSFETTHIADGLSLDAFSSQREKPVQWSVNAGAGIQLNPLPNIGIFAEPGVSYYFNDGSSLATIYKERPCSFNLNIGIRFNLNP